MDLLLKRIMRFCGRANYSHGIQSGFCVFLEWPFESAGRYGKAG